MVSRILSAWVVFCVAALPLAPATHVHEAGGEEHHERLIHSHGGAHHPHESSGPHHEATFDDQDTVVLTVHPVFAPPHPPLLLAPPAPLEPLTVQPPSGESLAVAVFVEPLIHGPPRSPAVPRGPPSVIPPVTAVV